MAMYVDRSLLFFLDTHFFNKAILAFIVFGMQTPSDTEAKFAAEKTKGDWGIPTKVIPKSPQHIILKIPADKKSCCTLHVAAAFFICGKHLSQ